MAVHGGTPACPDGPPPWPLPDPEVAEILTTLWEEGDWGRYHGPYVDRLAQQLAEMHRVPYVLPCCSGTFAVELALRAIKVGEGDEVVLAGYDFSGNFRCIEAVGARPVLVDVDPNTSCLDAQKLAAAVGPRTRAVIVSHLHGGIADMQRICEVAAHHRLLVVEDACQAPGATVQGRIAGSWGDVAVLSFGGSKLLTAGRGGAILTAQESLFQRAKIYCERGNDAFPISQLQAAVLLPQLEKLAERNRCRQASVEQLLAATRRQVALQPVGANPAGSSASFYKVAWRYDGQLGGVPRAQLLAAIRAEGVAMDVGFRGFTRRGARRCRRAGALEHGQRAAESTVLLHHPVLLESPQTIHRVGEAINKVLDAIA